MRDLGPTTRVGILPAPPLSMSHLEALRKAAVASVLREVLRGPDAQKKQRQKRRDSQSASGTPSIVDGSSRHGVSRGKPKGASAGAEQSGAHKLAREMLERERAQMGFYGTFETGRDPSD
eukprot:CAMPEP_0179964148 /NCGR_PEP_ID=MMETSP0983-20121128/31156_1 /TAXON_ID=483367 /ORGANISM="non described non described, Strain CCMP 2436" /LENGTH=119 /DNA_ID=CAMNT_0021876819 /DNA_START=298 /DNA_END=654 /DNA_ORIENTATION=-